MLERFARVTVNMEVIQEASDGLWDVRRNAAVADRACDGGYLAHAAANAEIVGIDHLAVVLDFFPFDTDVRNPVLTAGIGAPGDVKAKIFLVVGEALFELFGEPTGKGLG